MGYVWGRKGGSVPLTSLMRRAARLSQDMSLGISEYLIFVHENDAFAALGPTTDMGSPSILEWSAHNVVLKGLQHGALAR